MDNLNLKKVEKQDLELLKEYNNDFNNNGWVSEDKFVKLLSKWNEEMLDPTKVHFHPFWLMLKEHAVGLIIIKTNIEVDEVWRKYGGHISYVISPTFRKKGFGMKSLNLALEKCKELGLNNVMITCLMNNIGSQKIIEANYGKLDDIYIDPIEGKMSRRYFVDVDESLKLYQGNSKSRRS